MPNGVEVGEAYVTVKPKVDESSESLGTNFGKKFSGGMKGAISSGAVMVGNILADMVTNVASTVGEQISKTFTNYADYEQLVGGVDTLFKGASETVQANAKQAFKTAGMSANEYMENVTSFSASLISSLDGDTQKAAEIANMAMVDMSDNANKMGTNIDSIVQTYQSLARGNYAMLDNLKIGYGGTKAELERLLDDAGKLAGVEFNIDSYSDVIQAIHIMQEQWDITGTTAEEGATTISGSINQLQGAWDNFLTAIGDGGRTMDLSQVTADLMEAVGAVADNVGPALARIGEAIVIQLPQVLADAFADAPAQLEEMLASIFGEASASNIVENLLTPLEGLGKAFTDLAEAVAPLAEAALPYLTAAFGAFLEFVTAAVGTVASFVGGFVELIAGIADICSNLLDAGDDIDALKETVGQAWDDVVNSTTAAWDSVSSIPGNAANAAKAAVSSAFGALKGIVSTVWNAVTGAVSGAVNRIRGIMGGLSSVVGVASGIFNRVKSAIATPINAAKGLVSSGVNAIKGAISGMNIRLPHIALPHFWVHGGSFPWGVGGQGSPPEFGVNWYAKGGIAGLDGEPLIGAGEAGPELMWPRYEPYFSKYADALAKHMDGNGETVVNVSITGVEGAESAVTQLTNELKMLKHTGVL